MLKLSHKIICRGMVVGFFSTLIAPSSSMLAQDLPVDSGVEEAVLDTPEPSQPVDSTQSATTEASDQIENSPPSTEPATDTPPATEPAAAAPLVNEEAESQAAAEESSEPTSTALDSLARESQTRLERSYRKRMFGTYRVRIGAARPKFDDGLKCYEAFYGSPSNFPMISGDWFAWDWYATFGVSLRAGYYFDQGHAVGAQGVDKTNPSCGDLVPDRNQRVTTTLLPMQAALTTEFTPFAKKWIVVDAWLGFERLYFRESRVPLDSAEKKTTTTTSSTTDDKTLTNRGFKNASVLGVSVNILLNPLDDRSAHSMENAMGLGYVYVSPFVEIVRTMSKEGISYGRSVIGLGFTFESVK